MFKTWGLAIAQMGYVNLMNPRGQTPLGVVLQAVNFVYSCVLLPNRGRCIRGRSNWRGS